MRRSKTWVAVTLAACALLVACQLGEYRAGAIVSKIVASLGFLAVAASSGAFGTRYGRIIFAGLLLSALGDVLLLGAARQLFLLGLASFLLAHLAYVGAFASWGINWRWSAAAAVPVIAATIAVSVWLTAYLSDDMLLPVRAYTVVIGVMVIAAFGTRGAGGTALIPVGAVLFYVSDLSVAAVRFVQPDFPHYAWGLPLYYSGQLLLALSVAAAMARYGGGARQGRQSPL